ncbi:hypothetical protein HHK36_018348 [Tetracentron sinense]|uniref:60S ribosomal protein L35 n=1 Tax=Tetracentron sinense TaxID=13715 RepID=A0A834YVQ7_TETSI|nr:hypothetical protein HHK36_018348 [Tetracentron sinense]
MARIKVHELRGKPKSELLNQLNDLKAELALLRVAKVTGGAPNKLSKMCTRAFSLDLVHYCWIYLKNSLNQKVVRLSIAQVLTVISQKQKAALREAYKKKKFLPLDLRPKKTRAIRKRLTKHQFNCRRSIIENTESCSIQLQNGDSNFISSFILCKSGGDPGVEFREGFTLKITERNRRTASCTLWVPEEAITWLSKTITEFIGSVGYCFRKFRGKICTLMGEKRSNERGEFLVFQSFLGEGAGGRVFIPKGVRSYGWYALLSALGSVSLCPNSLLGGGLAGGELQRRKLLSKRRNVNSKGGLECCIEKPGYSRLVVEVDVGTVLNWDKAVVCAISGPEESDDWGRSQESSTKSYRRKVGSRNVVGFRRWWPEANSLSFTGFVKSRWLSLKGIPFHPWLPSVIGKVGALCGGLVEIHPSTVDMSDLSFAKIKVRGEINLIPRRITIMFQSISYPVEISVWEDELCDNCKMWPETMEIRYSRRWVVANGESKAKGEPRVRRSFKPSPIVVCKRLSSQREARKGEGKAKSKRRFRRQRLRRQRRLGVFAFHTGGLKVVLENEKGIRADPMRGAKEDVKSKGLESSNPGCMGGPLSNGPNQVDEPPLSYEVRLFEKASKEDKARPSYEQANSNGLGDPFGLYLIILKQQRNSATKSCPVVSKKKGVQVEVRGQEIGGSSTITPLFRQVKSILQRHRGASSGLLSSACRGTEEVARVCEGEPEK